MPNILIIEDSPSDIALIRRALKKSRIKWYIEVLQDGEIALEKLKDSSKPLPSVVLLDIVLSGKGGEEIITLMKKDERLCNIPVIVFSENNNMKSIMKNLSNIQMWMTKPKTFSGYISLITGIEKLIKDNAKK